MTQKVFVLKFSSLNGWYYRYRTEEEALERLRIARREGDTWVDIESGSTGPLVPAVLLVSAYKRKRKREVL